MVQFLPKIVGQILKVLVGHANHSSNHEFSLIKIESLETLVPNSIFQVQRIDLFPQILEFRIRP